MFFRYLLLFVVSSIATCALSRSVNNGTTTTTMLFQLVDASHLALWVNWWAVALETDAVPVHWSLHLVCIGSKDLDFVVRKIHLPGCSQIVSAGKRIYYTKALAFTTALRLGHNLLIVDVDAILIKNPTFWLLTPERSHFDIISSRDNGPSKLPFAADWGPHRFCTGFTFLRYSPHLLDFMEHVLKRVDKLGHDQIQFNHALSSSGVVWERSRRVMEGELPTTDLSGFFAWPGVVNMGYDPSDGRWQDTEPEKKKLVIEESLRQKPTGKTITGDDIPRKKLHVQLLASSTVLRNCHMQPSPPKKGQKTTRFIENAMPIGIKSNTTAALHCFWDEGPRGEQGVLKREMKTMIALGLHHWVLRDGYIVATASLGVVNPSLRVESTSILLGRTHPANRIFLESFVDPQRMQNFQEVWVKRNATYHVSNPLRAMIKRGYFISKLGMAPIESASTSTRPRDAAYNRTRPQTKGRRPRLESA